MFVCREPYVGGKVTNEKNVCSFKAVKQGHVRALVLRESDRVRGSETNQDEFLETDLNCL